MPFARRAGLEIPEKLPRIRTNLQEYFAARPGQNRSSGVVKKGYNSYLQYSTELNMESPLQLELDGVKSSPYLDDLIHSHLAKIEKRFGRATACRVVVRAPNAHHRNGAPYEVSVRIALPAGREINVGHTPGDDERLADLTAAVNDAFKRALRQLADETDQMQGRVKRHAEKAG